MPTESWPYLIGFLAAVGVAGGARWLLRGARTPQVSETPEGSLSMRVLGGYRLVELLGRGGMGAVYLAVPDDTLDPGQAVACKVVAREHLQNPEFRLRFLREIAICQRLDHPHIVKLHRSGEEDGRVFLLLELVQGDTLRSRIPRDPRTQTDVLEALFDAVSYAHRQGVVHRDLKPENVMITRDGAVKVMDFGLARQQAGERVTGTGGAVGTPSYMAPEQLRGAPAHPAQDQYALGALVYEMQTGHPPFAEKNVAQLIFDKLSRPAPPAPGPLQGVLARMLEREPQDRYPSVAEAYAALREALA